MTIAVARALHSHVMFFNAQMSVGVSVTCQVCRLYCTVLYCTVLYCMLQEARFDRHFVRDLTWSRHQLEELAERRFVAAQRASLRTNTSTAGDGYSAPPPSDVLGASFADLFKKVCFSVYSFCM